MTCYVCNDPAKDTRPYGERGQPICFDCMKASPEREAVAKSIFGLQLKSAGQVVFLDLEHGPIPYSKDALT